MSEVYGGNIGSRYLAGQMVSGKFISVITEKLIKDFLFGGLTDKEANDVHLNDILDQALKLFSPTDLSNKQSTNGYFKHLPLDKSEAKAALNILIRIYKMNIDDHNQSEGVSEAILKLEKVKTAAEKLHQALSELKTSPGAHFLLDHYESKPSKDLQKQIQTLGPILDKPLSTPYFNNIYPEYTMLEKVEALAVISCNSSRETRLKLSSGGNRNVWSAVRGSPLLILMGGIAWFLNGKVKLILPLARLIHEGATIQPPPAGEWGMDETARARKWYKQIANSTDSHEIHQLILDGPGAIPSPKQARNKRNRTTMKV